MRKGEELKSIAALVACALAAVLLFGLSPSAEEASAKAKACGKVKLATGGKARVAAVKTNCRRARQVAIGYYERRATGSGWDGIGPGGIFYRVRGYRCFTGLGGTQALCRAGRQQILASARPQDRPAQWRSTASEVFWKTYRETVQVEPSRIYFSTGASNTFWIYRLNSWRGWGTGIATATGHAYLSNCRPDCSTGDRVKRKVKVRLSAIRDFCGQRRYMNFGIKVFGRPRGWKAQFGSDCGGLQTRRPWGTRFGPSLEPV